MQKMRSCLSGGAVLASHVSEQRRLIPPLLACKRQQSSSQVPPSGQLKSTLDANLPDALQVAFIGSGAWATAAARLVARNIQRQAGEAHFQKTVKMWVHEEEVKGRSLSNLINEKRENVRYLPGIDLPQNLVASSNIEEVALGGNVLIFCLPHQFVLPACKQLKKVRLGHPCAALSLVKGMQISPNGPHLISSFIEDSLGMDCSVLMGANIAEEVAQDQLSEGTIGCHNQFYGQVFQQLFQSPRFLVSMVPDVAGVEMAGTLKNIVALGAGFVDGLGCGSNTKATIIRRGFHEILSLSKALFPGVQDSTFLESCGIADLVASCYGGRNRRVAEAFVRAALSSKAESFEALEERLLAGQKLQGVLTSNEVQGAIAKRGWEQQYPLLTVINAIVQEKLHPREVLHFDEAIKDL